ncbi:MAG: DUF922 domain-containing protein [Pseudomonadota bacterium]
MQPPNPDPEFRTRKRLRFVVVTLLILAAGTLSAFANPAIQTNHTTYPVTGIRVDHIMNEFRYNGLNNHWAYTRWHVSWTGHCLVSLEITYIMPEHTRKRDMPANLRASWDRMMGALWAHELQHGTHAMNAAQELVNNGCQNGNAIIAKWQEQDRLFDEATHHGRTQGVIFP